TSGFEVSARRVLKLHADIFREHGLALPELDLGGGFGIAYTTQDSPAESDEPGRAIVGPSMFTLYEVGTVKDVDGIRTYVSVDGGMSDNIRTALYDAAYSATVAGRASAARPMLARVVGKHCESGDV